MSDDGKGAMEVSGLSIVTDLKAERKRVALATFAVLAGAASYIIMLFTALPISVHLIVNVGNGCVPEEDTACFGPTSESQKPYTLIITLLRLMTFLFGTFVGTVSDRYGRRPMLILALCGYSVTAVCFIIGWATQSLALFFVGGIILGASSPITPHGVAYVSDISQPNRLATNLGILQGIGYFIGLMTGAVLSLAIALLTTGKEDERGDAGIASYDKLFYGSYGAGLIFSASSAIVTLIFLPESLHEEERTEKIDIVKANPLGFIPLITRNAYMFMVWLSACFAWMAVGASEVVTGGWWIRRYLMTDVADFITYTVLLWVASGLGSVIMTKIYVSMGGLKFAVHISAIFTIALGVVFALAPTVTTSYIAIGVGFLASSVYPTTLAVLMGQVGPREKGALSGALRSSEALAKLIGILVFGNAFASYIEEFKPDATCIPATFGVDGSKVNTCECGVESCPLLIDGVPTWIPSNCSLGQLSPSFEGKPSKSIAQYTGEGLDPLRILPNFVIEAGIIERPEECIGSGMISNKKGFVTELNRAWCASVAEVGEIGNQELGCPGFDLQQFGADANFLTCSASLAAPTCNEDLFNAQLAANYELQSANFTKSKEYYDVLTAGIEWQETCPEFGKAELNLCLGGPIADFPGLFPMMYMSGLGVISYICFIIAELLFVSRDKRFWIETEEEKLEEAHIIAVSPIDEN